VALVEGEGPELSLKVQADLLSLSRSSLYYQPVQASAQEVAIKHRIDEIYTQYPFYGSRRITVQLQREGIGINRKAVQRRMREMGISGICPGPNLSKRRMELTAKGRRSDMEHRVYPYLLGDIISSYPNHVWGIDITYIRLRGGWMYLVAILDWFSRYVVSWELDQRLEMGFVLAAVERALVKGRPAIWNSDQGSHFTSPQYIQRLEDAGVQISMDGKGRAIDNVFTERLWRTIKYEEVYLKDYTSPREARQNLGSYIEFYNHERPHQSLDYQTPARIYLGEETCFHRSGRGVLLPVQLRA